MEQRYAVRGCKMKKATLEISVTAIVILIIAVITLGLILGFVRGMFGRASEKFEEMISAEPDPPIPYDDEPITLSRETIITHAKEAEILKISVYNPTNRDWENDSAWPCDSFSDSSRCGNSRNQPQYGCVWYPDENRCCKDIDGDDECDADSLIATPCIDLDPDRCVFQMGCMIDNTDNTCKDSEGATPYLRCNGLSDIKAQVNAKTIKQGEYATFNYLMIMPSASPGSYLCEVWVYGYHDELSIKIRR